MEEIRKHICNYHPCIQLMDINVMTSVSDLGEIEMQQKQQLFAVEDGYTQLIDHAGMCKFRVGQSSRQNLRLQRFSSQ